MTMKNDQVLDAITERYDSLVESSCCLSCGGAAGRAGVRPGETCVDLGSGRGTDTLRLAEEAGPEGFAYGIDITPAMIEKARRTAERLGVTNAAFMHSELTALPLPSATVDCVVSNCTLNHVSDKQAVWREIHRVLKPGGRFIVSDIYAAAEVPDQFSHDPAKVAECWAGAQTRDTYLATVQGAGFVSVAVVEESEPYGKGEIEVASFTLTGKKPSAGGCGCGGSCQ
jgi:arsenite methyltransferase